MKRCKYYLVCMICFLVATSAQAELVWDTTEHSVEPTAEEDAVVVQYFYTNVGEHPITLRSFSPQSKGMGARFLSRSRTVEPGQSGAIELRWPIKTLFKKESYHAELRTDEREGGTRQFALHVSPEGWSAMTQDEKAVLASEEQTLLATPLPLSISTTRLAWRSDAPKDPKEILITINSKDPIHIQKLIPMMGDLSGFKAEWEELDPGRKYRVIITPSRGDQVGRRKYAMWLIGTDMTKDMQRRQWMIGKPSIYAVIYPGRNTVNTN